MDTIRNIFQSINIVTVIIAFPGNFFIVVVNVLDFFKNVRLSVSDQLILGFSVFNLLYELDEEYILSKDLLALPNNEYLNNEKLVFIYVNLCTLWFSALLSVHFCLKIVNINHRFYIYLQRRFPKMFPWIILAFLVGYFFLSLSFALVAYPECLPNTTSGVKYMNSSRCSWLLAIFTAICVLCAMFCLVSALTILISLLRHMKRIEDNTEGSRSPNMDAHIRAMKTVITLLAANILIFISVSILVFTDYPLGSLFGILISICHILSSFFLVKGTKKLDKTLVEILNWCSRK
ncbi:taste receptor type 2 member 105-like [Leptodactylus fuscus]|uniref:taste receptor type 2 member 105-like n=1 Tax=Leptodactylus fuscus TaxID=238119 RepID=UPI003F4EAF9A